MRGYFDVDCRELSEDGTGWVFRPRVEPLAEGIFRLLERAAVEKAPVVATTCGSGRSPHGAVCPDGMVVPLDPFQLEWRGMVPDHRFFHLEKKPRSCRTFDDSPNASELFALLGVREWVVFGNALELCVDQAVAALLERGFAVTFVSDLLAHSHTGTSETRIAALARWRALGAGESTLAGLLADVP